MTSSRRAPDTIRIGVAADEPVRVAGLASIFDLPGQETQAQLVPVIAPLTNLLELIDIHYIVVDLHSAEGGLGALEMIGRERPDIRSIVIGPDSDDELVLSAIIAGARGFLGESAGPELVRSAIDVVTSGSIWAPRRLLCRVIDRLLQVPGISQAAANEPLTRREQDVLELILRAHSTREIARQLGIDQRTVKVYVGRLMRKSGADNRIKLSLSALGRSFAPAGQGFQNATGNADATKRSKMQQDS